MFPLMRLPDEIILRVVEFVRVEDITAFVRCSKTIRSFARAVFYRHQQFKRKYSTIILQDLLHFDHKVIFAHESLFALTGTMLSKNDASYYPQKLLVGYFYSLNPFVYHGPGSYSEVQLAIDNSLISEKSSEFDNFISDCPFIQDLEKNEWRAALYNQHNSSIAIALLFAILTNIKLASFKDWCGGSLGSDCIWKMVERISEHNRCPKSRLCGKSLSQLQKFEMEFRLTRNGGNNIKVFAPFATLPSIRSLHGKKVKGRFDRNLGPAFKWPLNFRARTSTITKIDFSDSYVDAHTFRYLLAGIKALEEFKYNHSGRVAAEYQPRGIVGALRKCAATTLRKLDLVASMGGLGGLEYEYVGSLRMFTALKDVRVDDKLFKGPIYNSPGFYGETIDSQFDAMTGCWKGNGRQVKKWSLDRLVDILPAAVETLTLWSCNNDEENLFRDMRELKRVQLPNLRRLVFDFKRNRLSHTLEETLKHVKIHTLIKRLHPASLVRSW